MTGTTPPQDPPAEVVIPIDEWGLLPGSESGEPLDTRAVIRHWFVHYNPLYFFSAFCVLAGVYLVASDLGRLEGISFEAAGLGLFGIIQAYELLLVAGAAFLVHRAGAGRPAAILALLEMVFIYDSTFRLESVAHLEGTGLALSVGWVALAAIKIGGLAAALRLRVPPVALGAAIAGAAGIAAFVQVLSATSLDRLMVYQVAGWYGAALLLLVCAAAPRLETPLAAAAADRMRVARAVRATLWLLGGFYFYHLWNHIVWIGIGDIRAILGQIGVGLLLATLLRRKESEVWMSAAATIGVTVGNPPALAWAALLVAGALAWQALRGGGSQRFLVGAALVGWFGLASLGWIDGQGFPALPGIGSWKTWLLLAALGWLAWRRREPLAWIVLGLGALGVADRYEWTRLTELLPESNLGWGIALLVVGFAALVGGVGINWWLRRDPATEAAVEAAPTVGAGERAEGET